MNQKKILITLTNMNLLKKIMPWIGLVTSKQEQKMSKLVVVKEKMTFKEAFDTLMRGGIVRRKEWGENFVFRQVPSIIQAQIVPKMQSLPDSVKSVFAKRFSELPKNQVGAISYDNQFALVSPKNEISGYRFSENDEQYTEWQQVEAEPVLEENAKEETTPDIDNSKRV